jgi:segregation and condensation protein A
MNSRLSAAKATKDGNFETLWDDDAANANDEYLTLDIGGFEGPLDLLLHLAREQKVDLLQISVLELAEQYLRFVEQARALRLDLAADYLVMAAWLAFLKSKLLIPKADQTKDGPGEELASLLQFRLARLEAMRNVAQRLMAGRVLGRDVFPRGMPEAEIVSASNRFAATLYDLLSAYGEMRQRVASATITIRQRRVWALKEARDLLQRMLGTALDWTELDSYILHYVVSPEERVSALASSFAASLEMVKERQVDMRQDRAFGPLMLRAAPSFGAGAPVER